MKKLSLLFLSLSLTLSIVGCQTKDNQQKQTSFDNFINEKFIESMSENYLSVHPCFEHPENYGIDKSKVVVSMGQRFDTDTFEKDIKELKQAQNEFKRFDRKLLDETQQETFDIYQTQLKMSELTRKEDFQYLGSLFEDGNGLHVQLTYLFEHFPIRQEKDAKDLVTLIKDVKPYIESALAYTKKQEEKRTLMINIDSVIEYCQKIVDKGMKSSLLKAMKKSIDTLDIETSQKIEYKNQLEDAFQTSFITAYQDIINSLRSLDKDSNNTLGLSHLKNGKEYYETLVKRELGQDISIKEVKSILEKTATKYLTSMINVTSRQDKTNEKIGNEKTHYSDYRTILSDLDKMIENKFPKVEGLDYEIKTIDPEVTSESIAAYFNVPAIDQSTPMQIRVNGSSKDSDIRSPSLFATVAHEGIPGHMYQNAYVKEHFSSNPYRVFASSNNSYVEGYAKYVELLSYDYIQDISQDAITLLRSEDVYSSIQIVLADIGIHYEGWDVKQFQSYLNEKGLSMNDDDAQRQYNQLQSNPAIFISYFVGFSIFDTLRDETENILGKQFNEKDYHEAILKSGEAPFSVVKENVKDYINK